MREAFDIAMTESNLDKATQIAEALISEYGIDNTEVMKIKTELDMERSFGEEE